MTTPPGQPLFALNVERSTLNVQRSISEPDAPPGSPPTKALKARREFSSVIERAMDRREGSPRSTRSLALQRDNASPNPGHAKIARLPKPEALGANESDVENTSTDHLQQKTKRVCESDNGPLIASTGTETPAPTDNAVASEASGAELSMLPAELPQNVIPFPAPSVIIPFPLAEAKAMGSPARSVEGALLNEALGEEPSLNVQRSTFNAERSTPTANGSISRPATSVSSDATDGFDVSGLGLAPADEMEKPMNVHMVEFASASAKEEAAQREPAILSVAFRPAQRADAPQPAQTQLPSQSGASEESAPTPGPSALATESRPPHLESAKPSLSAGLAGVQAQLPESSEATGISAARQKGRMKSPSNSESAMPQATPLTGREPGRLAELPEIGSSLPGDNGEALDFSARTLSAMEWQTGRPVSSSDRPSSDAPSIRVDTTGTVERISRLVLSEVALIKQHSSDSLAVVLRPDAETELFVHLTQRNGQIEATVRCERGDLQHLGALWGQLQDSLAQQKVRLAPLEQPPSDQSNFHQPTGSDASSGQGSPRRSPEKQSMDEWPAPAPSSTDSAHVRGRGGSRHRRLTTSRPGWETWA